MTGILLIANMAGISCETVTRIRDKWYKDGESCMLENRRILLKPDFILRDLKWIMDDLSSQVV